MLIGALFLVPSKHVLKRPQMKYLLSILAIFLLTTTVYTQSFQYHLQYPGEDELIEVAPYQLAAHNDGSFGFLHGEQFEYNNVNLSLHAPDATVEWAKKLAPSIDSKYLGEGSMIATSDGGFLVVANLRESLDLGPLASDCGLVKLDAQGELEWARYFPGLVFEIVEANFGNGAFLKELDDGYLICGSTLDRIVVLRLDEAGMLLQGYQLFVGTIDRYIVPRFGVYESQVHINVRVFEGPPTNYITSGSVHLVFDYESGEMLRRDFYDGVAIWDMEVDEDGSIYTIVSGGSFEEGRLIKYQPDGTPDWSRAVGRTGSLFLEESTVGLHYRTEGNEPLGGVSKIDKATGDPISGSVSRLWHNILYSYFDVEPLSSQARLGHYFFTGPDFGHAVLYRTEADGSFPDCPSVERCDLEMPAAPHLDPEPIPVDIQPYNQQELLPLTLEDYPVTLTPFCLPLEPAAADFSIPDTLCRGEVLTLEAAATDLPTVSIWELPGLLPEPLNGDTVLVPLAAPGVYDVVHIRTAYGCADTVVRQVVVEDGPFFELGPDTVLCPGDSIRLESGLTAGSYSLIWQNGDTSLGIWATQPGTYQLTATGLEGCAYEDAVEITPGEVPTVNLGRDTAFCDGDTFSLSAENGVDNHWYQWSTGEVSPEIQVAASGNYSVTVTDLENGCSALDTVVLAAVAPPVFTYSPDTVYSPGVALLLQANADMPVRFFWPDGSAGNSFSVDSVGAYLLIADHQGCADSVVINVIPGECSTSIFIPTAFSPNNDGTNDVFEVYGPDVEIRRLRIFNRWGGLLFDQMGAEACWDGEAAGEVVNTGAYLYLIDYRNVLDGSLAQKSGVVQLRR